MKKHQKNVATTSAWVRVFVIRRLCAGIGSRKRASEAGSVASHILPEISKQINKYPELISDFKNIKIKKSLFICPGRLIDAGCASSINY